MSIMDQLAGGPSGPPPPGPALAPPPPPVPDLPPTDLAQGPPPDPSMMAAITGGSGTSPADQGSPPGPGDEVDALKTLISIGHDYMDIPTVEHSEKQQMMKALLVFQTLLASNQKMNDQATGASSQTRKLLGGAGGP